MRPFHFLLFVLVAVVFNSCMQEKTQLVTEKIQYDVNIKSPDPDYDWWIQNLPGPQRENLVDMIMDGALSGKFQAYDYFNNAITPGGSSGGAAAATAAGIGCIGHGTDIGGSIRYPAYACGLHGLRPTLGRVPAVNFSGPERHIGGQLMAVSGPLARTIADVQLGFEAMTGADISDPWWVPGLPSS